MDWMPTDSWSEKTLPELESKRVTLADLKRSVYVIRLNGEYCIDYPTGTSPALYVGEGNFRSRIRKHRKWVDELTELVGKFSFQICIAIPRVRKNGFAYQDADAAILEAFGRRYGSAPLWAPRKTSADLTTAG